MSNKKYTVITGTSSGIGYAAAKAFAARGKNLIVTARREAQLARLRDEITAAHPDVDVVIRTADLSVPENAHRLYDELRAYEIETWVNNAGFGSYGSVAEQNLTKIESILRLNIEALTILSTLFVHDYRDAAGAQLINISSCGFMTATRFSGASTARRTSSNSRLPSFPMRVIRAGIRSSPPASDECGIERGFISYRKRLYCDLLSW